MTMNSDDSELVNPCEKNKNVKGKRKSLVLIYVEQI